MIRRKAKSLVARVVTSPAARSLASMQRHGAAVVMYHGVVDSIVDPIVQRNHLTFSEFERQIDWLTRNYEIVSLEDLHRMLSTDLRTDRSQVAITFDDGYASVARLALPLLQSLGLPFTVFVTTSNIDSSVRFPTYVMRTALLNCQGRAEFPSLGQEFDLTTDAARNIALGRVSQSIKSQPWFTVQLILKDLVALLPSELWQELDQRFYSDRPLTWTEVLRIRDAGGTIGSHGCDHAILHGQESPAEVYHQLEASKRRIEAMVGECRFFAYPNGGIDDISPLAVTALARTGYQMGLTTITGECSPGCDLRVIPRVGARSNLLEFKRALLYCFRHTPVYESWVASTLAKCDAG